MSDIKKFIHTNVESVGLLELLSLLLREKNKSWTSQGLRGALRSSEQAVDRNLAALIKIGAIISDNQTPKRFSYRSENENLHKILTDLNAAYITFPSRVIEVIYNRSEQSLQGFSDAFKFRKDPKDG